jgi:ParB-like chromosome segregation protein Spo0J
MGRQALEDAKRAQHFFIDPLQPAPESARSAGYGGNYRVQIIGLDTEHVSKAEHPLWQARARQRLEESFVLNLRKYGNHNAVKVRKVKTGPDVTDYVLEVVDGRQRVRGMREAALASRADGTVAPRLKLELEKGDEESLVGIMISLNNQRFDDSPVARAKEAADLVNSLGYEVKEVAVMYGKSPQTIRNWLDLIGLDKRVQNLVDQRKLTATNAITLRDMPKDEQYERAVQMADAGTSTADAKAEGRRRRNGEKPGPKAGKRPGVSTLRRVVGNDDFMESLDPSARDVLLWVMGDEEAGARVSGLAAALEGDQA